MKTSSTRARLLLLDDQPSFRDILGDLLQMESYEVDVVATGGEAIDVFDTSSYDVLVFDRRLEENEDGLAVARQLKERNPNLKTILITGGRRVTLEESFQPDATLLKPFEFNSLVDAIEAVLQRPRSSSPVTDSDTGL